jgi:hypothetical protein
METAEMAEKVLDLTGLKFDEHGRCVLDDLTLREIERQYSSMVTAGAGSGTNSSDCRNTSNDVCRNTYNCDKSKDLTCTNTAHLCGDGIILQPV